MTKPPRSGGIRTFFRNFACRTAYAVGSPLAFGVALTVILAWAVTGPVFHYSDTWQLLINTGTTIVTFLMVFLIQNAQNRDTRSIQLKLNELIFAVKGARNEFVDLEEMPDDELENLTNEFREIYARLHKTSVLRGIDPGSGQEKE